MTNNDAIMLGVRLALTYGCENIILFAKLQLLG